MSADSPFSRQRLLGVLGVNQRIGERIRLEVRGARRGGEEARLERVGQPEQGGEQVNEREHEGIQPGGGAARQEEGARQPGQQRQADLPFQEGCGRVAEGAIAGGGQPPAGGQDEQGEQADDGQDGEEDAERGSGDGIRHPAGEEGVEQQPFQPGEVNHRASGRPGGAWAA